MNEFTARTTRRRLFGQLLLSLLVAGAAAGVLLFLAGREGVAEAAGQVSAGLLLSLLLLSLLNYLLRALRWHALCAALELRVPLSRNLLYYFAGLSMVFSPGKVGELVRLWLLRRGHQHPFERTAALLVADRVCDLAALLLLALATVSVVPGVTWLVPAAGAVAAAATLAFMQPSQLPILVVERAYRLTGLKPRWFVRLRRAVAQFERLALQRVYYPALLLSLLGWLSEAVALCLLLGGLGFAVSLAQGTFVFSGSMLVGAATLLPGGLGGTEASLAGLLKLLGAGTATALAATVIIRATTLWFAFLVGCVALPWAAWRVRETPSSEPTR